MESDGDKKNVWQKITRWIRYQKLRVLRIHAPPEVIARGVAIGVFVGLIPLLPSQTLIGISLAWLLGGSKLAAAIGTLISNPLNWVFLYVLFYRIGKALLPFDIPPLSISGLGMSAILDAGWQIAVAMLCGGFVLAIPASILAYFLSLWGIRRYRMSRARRTVPPQEDAERW